MHHGGTKVRSRAPLTAAGRIKGPRPTACDNPHGMQADVGSAEHAPVRALAQARYANRRRRLALVIGMLAYLAMAVAMFTHVLAVSATRGTTCACSDVSLFAWFFEWPLAAIVHGHDPFYSTAMFHPQGINLLSNTSVMGWTFLLLPVTALFGPIASLNVALIAAPVLSATAAMWVARRWVRSSAAAFVAGALYGFSPLVLFQTAGAHLMATSLFVPPLLLACLDELFVRRRHRPVRVGVALGLLLVVQFFLGGELLVMLVVASAISFVVVGVGALVLDASATRASIRAAAPGVGVAVVVAVVLLAWPVWFALDGPGHLSGVIWPGISPAQASIRSFFVAVPGQGLWWTPHWGRFMRPTYLGPPLVATIVLGAIVFRKDRRLVSMVAVGAVVAWLALGAHYPFAVWHYLDHVTIVRDVMNERFSSLLLLPFGIALALVLDHVLSWRPSRPAIGSLGAACLAAACVVPFALDAAHGLPYAASPVWQPLWYQRAANHLPADQVVLGFPFFDTSADLLAVQALHSMDYSIVGGTGPEWIASRQGAEEPGYKVLWQLASTSVAPVFDTKATKLQSTEVLAALKGWGVTLVVVPMASGPNTSVVTRSPWDEAVWLSSVLGAPSTADKAWVWHLTP